MIAILFITILCLISFFLLLCIVKAGSDYEDRIEKMKMNEEKGKE